MTTVYFSSFSYSAARNVVLAAMSDDEGEKSILEVER